MARTKIALIFNNFFGKNIIEALNIKEALEIYDNKVTILESNKNMIGELQKNNFDFVFNLARNTFGYNYSMSVASICELLELNLIGPNVFTSTICNDKEILFKLLQWDKIKTINGLQDSNLLKSINVTTLGSDCELILLFDLHDNYKIDLIPSNEIKETCKKSFHAVHASDFCEFYIYLDQNKNIYIFNINPIPFLDKNSNSAILFELMGFDYIDFVNYIVLNSFKKYKLPISESYLELEEKILSKTEKIAVEQ